jgi:hypothetical protein
MRRIAQVGQALASAMVVLFGRRGQVTEEARQQSRSRQALYRETVQVLSAVDGTEARERIEELERELARRSAEVERLQARLACAVEISEEKQAEFAGTGQAEGVSLPVLQRLLAVFLGRKTPSVATLGRQTAEAGRKSRELLKVLDEAARPHVREATADEIFLDRRRS